MNTQIKRSTAIAKLAGKRFATALLCALISLFCIQNVGTLQAHAAETSLDLQLAQGIESVNEAFDASGMLPGDVESIVTRVEVSHKESLTVYFKANITSEALSEAYKTDTTNPLSEHLVVTIVDTDSDTTVYTGTLALLHASEPIAIPLSVTDSVINWQITVSAPTSLSNEHQQASALVDFHWWVDAEEEDKLTPIPQTGDSTWPIVLLVVVALAAAIAFVAFKRNEVAVVTGDHVAVSAPALVARDTNYKRKAAIIAGVIAACIALAGVAWAMLHAEDTLPNNKFVMGNVDIEISMGDAKGNPNNLIEPNFTYQREFSVTNNGTADFYYDIYFSKFTGDLVPALEVSVLEGNTVLYTGVAEGFVYKVAEPLEAGKSRTFLLDIHMSQDAGNAYQDKTAEYELSARATQVKNNEGRAF